jgi:hypothetical protein
MNKNKIYLYKINKYKNINDIKYNKYQNKLLKNGGGIFGNLFVKSKDKIINYKNPININANYDIKLLKYYYDEIFLEYAKNANNLEILKRYYDPK